MKSTVNKTLAAIVLAALSACGGGDGGTTPAATTLTTTTSSATAPISIKLTADKSEIVVGGTLQFNVTATYADGTTALVTTDVTWKTESPTIVSIFSKGLVTGLALGTGKVTATVGAVSGSADVTVSGPYVFVAAGGNYSAAIKTDGTAVAWGSNVQGQLGTSSSKDEVLPALVAGGVKNWKTISTGEFHTVALSGSGFNCSAGCAMHVWGLNQFGQLGTGTQVSELAPTNKVGASPATDWLAVATGGSHTVALKKDSTLYTWGSNSQGQLAVGEAPGGYKLVPTQEIGKSKSWKAVAAGALHTIALQSSGVVARWGVNNRGQLGFPPATVLPAGFTPIFFDSVPYVSIAAGGDHTLAIRASDTTLWAWGANGFGQLGTGADGDGYAARQVFISDPEKSNTDWQMVAAGGGHNPVGADNSANGGHSVAIKKDGTLWAWGSNAYGQLGTGLSSDEPTPVQILVPKGTGRDDDWVMVSAGKLHTFARKKDGTLWGWGDNRSGQLGVGDTIQKPIVPTRIR